MAEIEDMEIKVTHAPTKWEYKIIWLKFNEEEALNEFGTMGWELITIIQDGNSLKAYLVRVKE